MIFFTWFSNDILRIRGAHEGLYDDHAPLMWLLTNSVTSVLTVKEQVSSNGNVSEYYSGNSEDGN
jgi:hypothetical protein